MKFHEATLDNGLHVTAELNDAVYSVAMGFFVRAGARDETSDVSGVSHFLEHMAFKGSEKYSADDVNRVFDEVGARYNASTSEEVTLYYAAVLPEYLERTFELLATLIRPSLRRDDFDMEKGVILEEIGMYQDQPTFTLYEKAMQAHFASHPLGRSILGTADSIRALTAEQMRAYHQEHYKAGNIVLAVAGNTDWDTVLDWAGQYCSHWPKGSFERPTDEACPQPNAVVFPKQGNVQEHVMQLTPAPAAHNTLRFAAELLSVVVGDDSGSRMYWDLVDPGHAEAAELGYNEYDGSGTFLTYLSCEPDAAADNLKRIHALYESINAQGISETELEQAKNKVASRVVLRGERPMGRLSSLGSNWVYRHEYRSVEADLSTLKSVSTDKICELIRAYPLGVTTTAAVGPLDTLTTD